MKNGHFWELTKMGFNRFQIISFLLKTINSNELNRNVIILGIYLLYNENFEAPGLKLKSLISKRTTVEEIFLSVAVRKS